MCENSDLEKFISKSYVQSKSDGKYHENRHFRIWFLKDSKRIQKILQKKAIFIDLKMFLFNYFQLWEKKDCVLYICTKVVRFEHIWKVENLLLPSFQNDLPVRQNILD